MAALDSVFASLSGSDAQILVMPSRAERMIALARALPPAAPQTRPVADAGASEVARAMDRLSARTLATRNRDRRIVDGLGPLKELYRDQLVYAGALVKNFLESYVVRDKFRARVVADGEARELEGPFAAHLDEAGL
jgi:hypothetical protein